MAEGMRLDKWLWAARFFKTRSVAAKAIDGGKVRVEGARGKPGRTIRVGQRLEIRAGQELFEVDVTALSDRRGPAREARTLYVETPESITAREQAAVERKATAATEPDFGGRPDKYQRRQIRKLLGKQR
jgi:ribosome-associated heat shock protein Hsp15